MLKKFFELIRFKFHKVVLKDDWLIDLDDIDPWTGEPFDFAPTADMIWDPSTNELTERFLPIGEPMPNVDWLKFEDIDEEVII